MRGACHGDVRYERASHVLVKQKIGRESACIGISRLDNIHAEFVKSNVIFSYVPSSFLITPQDRGLHSCDEVGTITQLVFAPVCTCLHCLSPLWNDHGRPRHASTSHVE